jgi:beta-glucuronidase
MLFPFETATRELKPLDGIWRLCFDPDRRGVAARYFDQFPELGALEVAVPGSINEQVTEREQYLNLDWVWYARSFRVPSAWRGRRIFLRFGAATHRADVYVNGRALGGHEGGFTPFELELTGLVNFETANLLVVRLDHLLSASTVPQGGLDPQLGGVAAWRASNNPDVHWDAFPFMGLHRPVLLYATGTTRIVALQVETKALVEGRASLRVRGRVDGPAQQLCLRVPSLGASEWRAGVAADGSVELSVELEQVRPWSPEQPQLYALEFSAEGAAGELLDSYRLDFGVRTLAVLAGQLLLNGRPIFLRGFGRHEDAAIVGRGLSLPHLIKDSSLLRWVGANSFRTSHYPYSEELMQKADRDGFLVIDEVAANTLSMLAVAEPEARAALAAAHRVQIDELIARDFNHACVIAWSLGNECETYLENDGYFGQMVRHAKLRDTSRPITFVLNSEPSAELSAHDFDLICVNLYPSWYTDCGKLDAIAPALERVLLGYWEKYGKPIVLSEFGADAVAGMHSEYPVMWSEEYQLEMIERVLDAAERYPFVVGTHVWNFADFKVGQHPARAMLNHKGVFTRERAPKLAAHALRRRWHKRP